MWKMLRPKVANAMKDNCGLPTTMTECFERALYADFCLTEMGKETSKEVKAKKKETMASVMCTTRILYRRKLGL